MTWTPEQRAEQCRKIAGAKSAKKAAASRENGKKGGRPRKNRDAEEAKPNAE